MGLRKQLLKCEVEELRGAYEWAMKAYVECRHWDERKDALKKDMDRAKESYDNCMRELY